jgi:hypothetical protein
VQANRPDCLHHPPHPPPPPHPNQVRILVATDLVGRGIDVERVNIVINYDMPVTDEMHGNGAGALGFGSACWVRWVRAACAHDTS